MEPLVLIAAIVLPALIILSHLSAKRQARQQHEQLMNALNGQREATMGAISELLSERLPAPAPAPAPVPAAPAEAKSEVRVKVSEDKLMVIAAVLACHFGKRVKVRSARRIMLAGSSNVWSQQGRAAVQAMRTFR
jgi:hypothetical protein